MSKDKKDYYAEETDLKRSNEYRKYQREYYAQNKERIKTQRRNRYQNDDEYRAEFNRKRRMKRNRKNMIESYDSLNVEEEVTDVSFDCMMKVLSADKTKSCVCKMYTMNGVALQVRVNKDKLVHWVYLKKIPNAKYRNGSNWRLYTEYEVDLLKRAFKHFRKKASLDNRKFTLTKEMTVYIFKRFDSLIGGIPEDKFVKEG